MKEFSYYKLVDISEFHSMDYNVLFHDDVAGILHRKFNYWLKLTQSMFVFHVLMWVNLKVDVPEILKTFFVNIRSNYFELEYSLLFQIRCIQLNLTFSQEACSFQSELPFSWFISSMQMKGLRIFVVCVCMNNMLHSGGFTSRSPP